MLAVLLAAVAAGLVFGVGDRGHQFSHSVPELRGDRRERFALPAAGGYSGGVVFDGVVQ